LSNPYQIFLKIFAKIRKKSLILPQKYQQGAVAQLVEQRTENPCVAGSIPAGTTQEPSQEALVFFFHI